MKSFFEMATEIYAGQKEAWKKELRKAAADGKPTDDMCPLINLPAYRAEVSHKFGQCGVSDQAD
jgi:hypothetical protein